MKTTPFTKYHIANGAKMSEFAGYNMPIEFTGINEEHLNVREKAGVFDVSHMGEIWIKGPKALDFLQRITSNNVAALTDGKVQYTTMPNGRGGIVDDLLVYRIDAETYLLVVNAANIAKDYDHIVEEGKKFGLTAGKEIYNASDEICQLAIQGPLAMKIVQKMCKEPVEDLVYYTFVKTEVAGIKDAILSATGYTGAGGCEIYIANEDADKLWEALWKAGEEYGLKNIGLGARDTLRLEKGFCLYGNESGRRYPAARLLWGRKAWRSGHASAGRMAVPTAALLRAEKTKRRKTERMIDAVDRECPRYRYRPTAGERVCLPGRQPIVILRLSGPVVSMYTRSVSDGRSGSIFSGHSTRQSAPLSKYSS